MKVSISDLDVKMELGNKGFVMSVYDNDGNYRGKLKIGKANLEWCKGKTRLGNGKKVHWNKLLEYLEADATPIVKKKASKKAAAKK